MNFKNLVLIPILVTLSFSSCRFEKRLYSKGFNVTSKKVILNKPKNIALQDWRPNKQEDSLECQKPIIDNKKAIYQSEKLIVETPVNQNSQSIQTNKITDYKSQKKEPKNSSYRTATSYQKSFASEPDEDGTPKFLPNADFIHSSGIAGILTILSLGLLGPISLILGALALKRRVKFPSLGENKNIKIAKFAVIVGLITSIFFTGFWVLFFLYNFPVVMFIDYFMTILHLITLFAGLIILLTAKT